MKENDSPGNGARSTRPGPRELHSHRTLLVAATPGEVMEALREAARCLDLALVTRSRGRLLFRRRFPNRRSLVSVEVVAESDGTSRVDLVNMVPPRHRGEHYPSILMDRVEEFVQFASRTEDRSSTKPCYGFLSRSRQLRFAQTLLFITGLAVIVVGRFVVPFWREGIAIAGIWLAVAAMGLLEALRRRVAEALPRQDIPRYLMATLVLGGLATLVVLLR
jgi:hypothetical protein